MLCIALHQIERGTAHRTGGRSRWQRVVRIRMHGNWSLHVLSLILGKFASLLYHDVVAFEFAIQCEFKCVSDGDPARIIEKVP